MKAFHPLRFYVVGIFFKTFGLRPPGCVLSASRLLIAEIPQLANIADWTFLGIAQSVSSGAHVH